MIHGDVPSRKEKGADREESEKQSAETSSDNIIWAYLKDIGHVQLLTEDEEEQIARKIDEAEIKVKNILFGLPQAAGELFEIGQQLQEGTVSR